jgi:4-amino-4-deoxy-L-arabinose transferase-like glycosyltransferase
MILWGIGVLFPATIMLSVGIALSGHKKRGDIFSRIKRLVMRRGLIISILLSLLAILVIIAYVFKAAPIIEDEQAYVFQASTYLTGNLFMPVPPAAESISRTFMIINWIWTTKYLWGQPAILSIGLLFGSPYFATVLMAIGSLFLIYSIAKKIYSPQIANLATLLMGTSPWFWFISGTLTTHVSTLFLFLLFIYGWLRLERRQSFALGAILGFCLGWAFTVRQMTTVCFAVPFAGLGVIYLWRQPRRWFPPALGFALSASIVVVLLLVYNTLVTGDPFTVPFLYYNIQERLGFGERLSGMFTPMKAMSNLAKNVFLINMWLFGWPISLLPLIAYLAKAAKSLFRPIRETTSQYQLAWNSWDTLWIVLIASHCFGYLFYCFDNVHATMPTYYYELLIPLTILSARGLIYFHNQALLKIVKGEYLIPTFVSLSFLTCILFFAPFRAENFIQRYATFLEPVKLAVSSISEKAIVFVGRAKTGIYPVVTLPYPSPKLDDKLLMVSLRNQKDYDKAVEAFPDRFPYIIFYDDQSAHYVIKKMPPKAKLSEYELSQCVNFIDLGKVDRTPPPPSTLFFLKFLGY